MQSKPMASSLLFTERRFIQNSETLAQMQDGVSPAGKRVVAK
jgi:hypothetical protein